MAFPLSPPMIHVNKFPTLSYVSSSWANRQAGDLVFFHSTSSGAFPSGWSGLGSDSFSGSAGGGETYNVYFKAGYKVLTGSDTQPTSASFRIFRYAPGATPLVASTASPANLTTFAKYSGIFTYKYSEGANFGVPAPTVASVTGGGAAQYSFTFQSRGSGNGSYQMYGRVDLWLALEPASYAISSVNSRFTVSPS